MDNTANLGLANGFMQGFSFMDNHYTNKGRRERAEERFDHEKEGWQREDDGRLIQAFQQGVQSGNIDPKIAGEFGRRFDVDWSNYADPEFGESLSTLESTLAGKVSMNSPEFKKAFGRTFRTEINKGTGEKFNDRTIEEKILRGVYPSPDSQSLMLDLDIRESGPNGESWRSAPVTDGRSASDDNVKAIPVEGAIKKLKGHRLMYDGIQKSPELLALVKQLAARNGTQLPKEEARYGDVTNDPNLGMIQKGPDGQVRVLKGLDVPKGQYSEPYEHPTLGLVQKGPDGKITPYNTGGNDYGEVIDHPQLGLAQKASNGKYVQHKKPDRSGSAGGPLSSSVMSQLQQTSKNFHGAFNPDGTFLGLPEKAGKKYNLALERAEELVYAGYPVFAATNLANLSVIEPLTPEAATEIAEREADDKGLSWGEKEKFVNQHSRSLLNKQNEAIELYKKFKEGQSAAPTQGLNVNNSAPVETQNVPQGLSVPKTQAPEVPPSQTGTIQRTPEPQATQTVKSNPSAEAKLKSMLSNANPEQHEQIKQQFVDALGYLPEGV